MAQKYPNPAYRAFEAPEAAAPETAKAEAVGRATFGVRLPMEEGQAFRIRLAMQQMHAAGELPKKFQVKPSLGVELIPLALVGRQIRRGDVQLERAQRARRLLEEASGAAAKGVADAEIAGVSVRQATRLQLVVENTEVADRREELADTLEARYGFHGVVEYVRRNQLAVELGKCTSGRFDFSVQESTEKTVLGAVDQVHYIDEPLTFGGAEVYPNFDLLGASAPACVGDRFLDADYIATHNASRVSAYSQQLHDYPGEIVPPVMDAGREIARLLSL